MANHQYSPRQQKSTKIVRPFKTSPNLDNRHSDRPFKKGNSWTSKPAR
jgi:hypothetical protein